MHHPASHPHNVHSYLALSPRKWGWRSPPPMEDGHTMSQWYPGRPFPPPAISCRYFCIVVILLDFSPSAWPASPHCLTLRPLFLLWLAVQNRSFCYLSNSCLLFHNSRSPHSRAKPFDFHRWNGKLKTVWQHDKYVKWMTSITDIRIGKLLPWYMSETETTGAQLCTHRSQPIWMKEWMKEWSCPEWVVG